MIYYMHSEGSKQKYGTMEEDGCRKNQNLGYFNY